MGDLSGTKRQPIDQLNYLLDARNKSIISYNDSLLLLSYERLSDFYFFQNKFSIAKNFLDDALRVIISQKVVDSYAYYHIQINAAIVENKAGNWDESLVKAMSVSEFAGHKNYGNMKSMAEAEIRAAYINKGALKDLAMYYTKLYPEKLKEIAEQDLVLYYRIMAYIYESKNNQDSAQYYFQIAESNMKDMSPAYQSNFYSRLADYYKRQNDTLKIAENYSKAFESASASNRLYMTVSAGDSFIRYDTKPSYLFLDSLNNLKDKLLLEQNNDAIRDTELSNVLKQKELEESQQHEEKSRKSNIQLQILALIIALIFMSMIFISNFRVPKWWFKIMSYISLITLFELILYIIVYRLDFITNKEPLKVLSIKVAIIAIITPLHHWIEHFVVNFLSNHKVLSEVGDKVKAFVKKHILRKTKNTNENVVH